MDNWEEIQELSKHRLSSRSERLLRHRQVRDVIWASQRGRGRGWTATGLQIVICRPLRQQSRLRIPLNWDLYDFVSTDFSNNPLKYLFEQNKIYSPVSFITGIYSIFYFYYRLLSYQWCFNLMLSFSWLKFSTFYLN